MSKINPSPLRVSTMTVVGHFGVIPDRAKLFHSGAFIQYGDMKEGIIKIEVDAVSKGICTDDILHQSGKEKKKFFNQSSLVFRLQLNDAPTFKEVNIKIFKNGGFQMTGISSEEMARAALTRFIDLNKGAERGIWDTDPTIAKFDVCMMNSDYKVNKVIRRDRLYRILVEEYGLWCSYEPTIYQGVNTKYFWNKTRPAAAATSFESASALQGGQHDVDANRQHDQHHAKRNTLSKFALGGFERNRGRNIAGETGNVAAHEQGATHFRDDSAEGIDDACHHRKSHFPERGQGSPHGARAKTARGLEDSRISALNRGNRENNQNRQGNHDVADHDRPGREQKLESA